MFTFEVDDGQPSSSKATTSPSITVSSGRLVRPFTTDRILDREILVVAGAQMHRTAALEHDGPVAIQSQRIQSPVTVGEGVGLEQQHRRDEPSLHHQVIASRWRRDERAVRVRRSAKAGFAAPLRAKLETSSGPPKAITSTASNGRPVTRRLETAGESRHPCAR